MINIRQTSGDYYGLLVFDYDETNDIFSAIKNEIVIQKGTIIPVTIIRDIYAHKNVVKNKVFLKIEITQSKSPDDDPSFVKTIWSDEIHLNSNYPINHPLKIIFSLDENVILNCRLKNVLENRIIDFTN